MKLSIIIPVFNEEKTIGQVIRTVLDAKIPNWTKEIIVIDDGSTDKTIEKIQQVKGKITIVKKKKNEGKGSAIQEGLKHVTGHYIIIQDADLEYDPSHITKLLSPISNKEANVVYGTRLNRLPNLKKDERKMQFFIHYLGNRMLSLLMSILYSHWLTDVETGYKVIPVSAMKQITIQSNGFEFEIEITAKLLRNGYKILEIPITTNPRTYGEGKKLKTIRDGTIALKKLLLYRIVSI